MTLITWYGGWSYGAPFDSEAWKNFNSAHPHFSVESRNMYLGLCTDGFNPFGSFAAPYSYWPIILTVYNLPPEMRMRLEFMFLSTVILGPNSPGWNIDVYLWPLIDELTQLWLSRALTYDVSTKQNFLIRATLMWIINDFQIFTPLIIFLLMLTLSWMLFWAPVDKHK